MQSKRHRRRHFCRHQHHRQQQQQPHDQHHSASTNQYCQMNLCALLKTAAAKPTIGLRIASNRVYIRKPTNCTICTNSRAFCALINSSVIGRNFAVCLVQQTADCLCRWRKVWRKGRATGTLFSSVAQWVSVITALQQLKCAHFEHCILQVGNGIVHSNDE